MKVEYQGIIFDAFTVETNDNKIIDIDKTDVAINTDDIKYAWGYICKDCAEKYEFNIANSNEEPEGMICYVDGCNSLNSVYSFSLSDDDFKNLNFFDLYGFNGIEPLTEKDYNVDLNTLGFPFKQISYYDLGIENEYKEIINGKPKYVEFDNLPVPYEIALVKAKNEIYEMFKNCKTYEEAKNIILYGDCLSKEKGYSVPTDETGHLYDGWSVVWGNNNTQTICWDVRWY